MAHLCVVTPCYNEQDNVRELHRRIRAQFEALPHTYSHLFIDNASTDGTVAQVKALIAEDSHVQLIVNSRNFGHIRSPFHGVLQAGGDAVIVMASDLQDPPEMIPRLIEAWEKGFPVVKAVRSSTDETFALAMVRTLFYWIIRRISDLELTKNYTGTGLYDRRVIEILRSMGDPYPYFRGLISEIGFDSATVVFHQAKRIRGLSSNNFMTLYDIAMLGITKHSMMPLRFMTLLGFSAAGLAFLIGLGFLVMKLIFWYQFQMGQAPMLIGLFFSLSLQMFFMGIIGEYVGTILTQVRQLPHAIEKERVNLPIQSESPHLAPPSSVQAATALPATNTSAAEASRVPVAR
jgi:glycosyltransferase involved in cell wall biosynthesis